MLKFLCICLFCIFVAAQDSNNRKDFKILVTFISMKYCLEFRQYTCIEHGETEVTDCRLTFMTSDDEPITVTESGCFMV